MKKIIVISNMYPSLKDPAFGTFVKVFTDGLKKFKNDYKVDKIVIKGKPKNIIDKLIKYICFYTTVVIKLLTKNYDYVYVHTITYPILPLRIVDLLRNHNYIFNVHGSDVLTNSKLATALKNLSRPLLSKCKYLIAPSVYFKQVVNEELPEVDKHKIIVSASGGIEKHFYNNDNLYSDHKRNTPIKIGYVSRIIGGKGWDTYIKSIRRLKDVGIEVDASIVGDGDKVEDMKNLIKKLNLDGSVNYIGALGHDNLPNYYKKLDLFIFPSEKCESLGLVGLEAMASSIPVIGSNIGGIKTYIIDAFNGYLFPPKDYMALADCIRKYISLDIEKKNQIRNNAYDTAREYESSQVINTLFNKILRHG